MNAAGYVYILINPSLEGIVKIGKTQNNPDARAKELSSATGVPTPFFVAYQAYFKDCTAAEVFVHTRLSSNRLAENKEFFHITVRQAIETVREAENSIGITPEPEDSTNNEPEKTSTSPLVPWEIVFHSANAHYYGIGDTIQDRNEAFQLYIKAAKLNSISAYWIIGNLYLVGHGCNQDIQKAKAAYMEGTKAGNDLCWTGLAEVYFTEGHFDNWDKCWKKYFASRFFLEMRKPSEYIELETVMSNRSYQMYIYEKQAKKKRWKIDQGELLTDNALEIQNFIKKFKNDVAAINRRKEEHKIEMDKREKEKKKKKKIRMIYLR